MRVEDKIEKLITEFKPTIIRPHLSNIQKYGLSLIRTGLVLIKAGIREKFRVMNADNLEKLCMRIFPNVEMLLMDMKYRYVDLKTMDEIIGIDWTNHKKYVIDIYDCDNFAFSFKSRMAEIWGINGVAVALGVLTIDKGKYLHAWNYFIAEESGKPKLFLLEPQLDLVVEAEQKTFTVKGVTVSYEPIMLFWY